MSDGEWTISTTPPSVRTALHFWWVGVACVFQGHDFMCGEHYHGLTDWRTCDRCTRSWRRDGCAARQCQETT